MVGMYDADALDYVMRDAYHSGTLEYGMVDVDRLLNTSFIAVEPNGAMLLCLHERSLPALRNFLIARLLMYETVYFHKTCRAFRLGLDELLTDTLVQLQVGDPWDDLDTYKSLDDFRLLTLHSQLAKKRTKRARRVAEGWKAISERKVEWKEAYVREEHFHSPRLATFAPEIVEREVSELRDRIRKGLRDLQDKNLAELCELGFGRDQAATLKKIDAETLDLRVDTRVLDVRPEDPLLHPRVSGEQADALVYNPRIRKVGRKSIYDLIQYVPIRYTAQRVYCRGEYKDVVALTADLVVQQR